MRVLRDTGASTDRAVGVLGELVGVLSKDLLSQKPRKTSANRAELGSEFRVGVGSG